MKKTIFILLYLLFVILLLIVLFGIYALDGNNFFDNLEKYKIISYVLFYSITMGGTFFSMYTKKNKKKNMMKKHILLYSFLITLLVMIYTTSIWMKSYYNSINLEDMYLNFHISFILNILFFIVYTMIVMYIPIKQLNMKGNII